MPDGDKELRARYGQLGDAELQALASDQDALTEAALRALEQELASRGGRILADERGNAAEKPQRWVTIRSYRDLSEAIVARSVLESAAIETYLRDENLIRLDWQVSNMIGGARLQVLEEDVEAATRVLEEPVPENIAFGGEDGFEQPHCPRCGSLEITYEGRSRTAPLLGLFVAALPLPAGEGTWSCAACGARWQEDEP